MAKPRLALTLLLGLTLAGCAAAPAAETHAPPPTPPVYVVISSVPPAPTATPRP